MDTTTEIIGFCAMSLAGLKHIPQLYKIQCDHNVDSFSKQAIIMALLASALWAYYGFRKNSPSVIVGAVGAILYEVYLLYEIFKSEKYKKE
jgi:uncharacterized protein with PQ loop repeat